jgi:hypothetical protein
VAIAVRLADASRDARFEYDALGYFLPNPSCTVDLATPTLDAYVRATRTILSTEPGAPAELELEVTIVRSQVMQTGRTGSAVVEHAVVLRTPSGPQVDGWRLRGESTIVGLGEQGIRNAFARAARDAAARLERLLSASATVAAWLGARGIAVRPAPPLPLAPPPPEPRAPWVAFLDAGGELLVASRQEVAFPPTLRGGISGSWFVAQAAFERWRLAGVSGRPTYNSSVRWNVSSMGLDVGGVLRVGASDELRAGVGARYVYGRTDVSYLVGSTPWHTTIDRSRFSTSIFVAYQVRAGVWTRRRVGLRVALELRKHFRSTLPADHFGPDLEIANVALGVTLGAELPIRRRRPLGSP